VLTTEYHPTAKEGSTKNRRCNALRSQDNKRVGSLVVTDTGATLYESEPEETTAEGDEEEEEDEDGDTMHISPMRRLERT
jgi:hypothetical protein